MRILPLDADPALSVRCLAVSMAVEAVEATVMIVERYRQVSVLFC
jgi:hypothetical protein